MGDCTGLASILIIVLLVLIIVRLGGGTPLCEEVPLALVFAASITLFLPAASCNTFFYSSKPEGLTPSRKGMLDALFSTVLCCSVSLNCCLYSSHIKETGILVPDAVVWVPPQGPSSSSFPSPRVSFPVGQLGPPHFAPSSLGAFSFLLHLLQR